MLPIGRTALPFNDSFGRLIAIAIVGCPMTVYVANDQSNAHERKKTMDGEERCFKSMGNLNEHNGTLEK